MKYFLTLLTSFILTCATAQNLVPNPSFESLTSPPYYLTELYKASPWFSPNAASPDLFCTCGSNLGTAPTNSFGTQVPHSGSACAGMSVFENQDWREYVSVQLSDTLKPGIKYWLRFYISLADNSKYSMNKIGAYFSSSQINQPNTSPLIFSPQILNDPTNSLSNKSIWTLVESSFIGAGGEIFMTIGNFYDPTHTDTVFVGGTGIPDTLAYFYIDDICLSNDSLNCPQLDFIENLSGKKENLLLPNPANQGAILYFDNKRKETCTLTLYDQQGVLVQTTDNVTADKIEIKRSNLHNGLYFYVLYSGDGIIATGKLVFD